MTYISRACKTMKNNVIPHFPDVFIEVNHDFLWVAPRQDFPNVSHVC